MHNKSLENTVFVYSAGAFGLFLRWLQRQLAFDERGLCAPSVFNWLLTIYLLVVAWVFIKRNEKLLGKRLRLPGTLQRALDAPGKLYAFLRWFCGAGMMLGGALVIRGSETEKYTLMLRVLGGLAILAGIGIPLYLGSANRKDGVKRGALRRLLSLTPLLLFGVWLIYDYRSNAINSVVWGFAIEVLTVVTLLLGYFRLAGFAYRQIDDKRQLFWIQYGIFVSVMVLADERMTGMQMILFFAGALLAIAQFILLGRLEEKKAPEAEKADPADAPIPDGGFERL